MFFRRKVIQNTHDMLQGTGTGGRPLDCLLELLHMGLQSCGMYLLGSFALVGVDDVINESRVFLDLKCVRRGSQVPSGANLLHPNLGELPILIVLAQLRLHIHLLF